MVSNDKQRRYLISSVLCVTAIVNGTHHILLNYTQVIYSFCKLHMIHQTIIKTNLETVYYSVLFNINMFTSVCFKQTMISLWKKNVDP